MVYVTQTRPLQTEKSAVRTDSSGSFSQRPYGSFNPSQTTTSWRTGRLSSAHSEVDPDEALLKARSQAAVFGALKEEYRQKLQPGDNGHTFTTEKRTIRSPWIDESPGVGKRYVGPLFHGTTSQFALAGAGIAFAGQLPSNAGYYGPAAIKATRPTNPNVNLANLFAELRREGLPDLPGLSSRHQGSPPDIGGEYLNYEFGYKPIARDVARIAVLLGEISNTIKQYERDAGRRVRRRMSFPPIRQTTVGPGRSFSLSTNTNVGGYTETLMKGGLVTGLGYEELEKFQEVSFSGQFSYELSSANSLWLKAKKLEQIVNHLFGTRVTPETIWNLTPWSWLSDWHINIGDNIANSNALQEDGLVIRYGYLMIHSITKHTITTVDPKIETRSGIRAPFSTTFIYQKKERVRASPYGFGSNPASYTDRQWAILGALGLTKAHKVLFD